MIRRIAKAAGLRTHLHDAPVAVLTFSSPDCPVCVATPEAAARYQIFNVPVVLQFLDELYAQVAHHYALRFGGQE